MKRIIYVFSLLLLSTLHFIQAQEEDVKQLTREETTQKLQVWLDGWIDFGTLYYITYTGEYNAEIQSIAQQRMKEVEDRFGSIIKEIGLDAAGMVGAIKDFKNSTGIHVYIVPQINTFPKENDAFAWQSLEDINKERIKSPVAPYLIIQPIVNGSKTRGYEIIVQTVASEDINTNKYKLKTDDKNVFNAPFKNKVVKGRNSMLSQIKESIKKGLVEWQEKVGDEFVPQLGITYGTERFAPGETIEVSHKEDYWEQIYATYPSGKEVRSDSVDWEIIPTDALSEEIIEKNKAFNEKNKSNWSVYNPKGSTYKIQNHIIKISSTNPLLLPSFAKYDYTYWNPKAVVGKNKCQVTYEVKNVKLNIDPTAFIKQQTAFLDDIQYIESFVNHPDIGEVPEFVETLQSLKEDAQTIGQLITGKEWGKAGEQLEAANTRSSKLKLKLDGLEKIADVVAGWVEKLPPLLTSALDSLQKKEKDPDDQFLKDMEALVEDVDERDTKYDQWSKNRPNTLSSYEDFGASDQYASVELSKIESHSRLSELIGKVKSGFTNFELLQLKKLLVVAFIAQPENFQKLVTKAKSDLPTQAPQLLTLIASGSNSTDVKVQIFNYVETLVDQEIENQSQSYKGLMEKKFDKGEDLSDLDNFAQKYVQDNIINKF